MAKFSDDEIASALRQDDCHVDIRADLHKKPNYANPTWHRALNGSLTITITVNGNRVVVLERDLHLKVVDGADIAPDA